MPIYTEEGEALVKHGKCHGVRIDLKDCLKKTDCVKKGSTMRDCLRSRNVPEECLSLANLMFECKRSLLDNRQRFREKKGY